MKTPIKATRRAGVLELAGASVPTILLRPESDGPLPAALLLHGYSSSKERLSDSIGRALAVRGIASLAIDLPLHGTRDDALIAQARSNPLDLIQHWRTALAEAKAAIDWLSGQPDFDPNALHILGYSLGSYIALQTAAKDKRVKSVIVAAGGDLPATPWTGMARLVADPLSAAKALKGRPLLMLHGRHDRTVKPEQAQRLFDAAGEPKELVWYDSGHVLPAQASDFAAQWVRSRRGAEG